MVIAEPNGTRPRIPRYARTPAHLRALRRALARRATYLDTVPPLDAWLSLTATHDRALRWIARWHTDHLRWRWCQGVDFDTLRITVNRWHADQTRRILGRMPPLDYDELQRRVDEEIDRRTGCRHTGYAGVCLRCVRGLARHALDERARANKAVAALHPALRPTRPTP